MFTKIVRICALVLHVFAGVGALVGGYACIDNPVDPMGAPSSMLDGSLFKSFLIPGLVLFLCFGVGNLVMVILTARTVWLRSIGEALLGFGMMLWIVIQVMVIHATTFMHVLFFGIGMVQVAIAILWFAKDGVMQQVKDYIR